MELPGERLLVEIWDTVFDQGVAGLLSPWQIRRTGRARAEIRREELLMLARTEQDLVDTRAGKKSFDAAEHLVFLPPSTEVATDALPGSPPAPAIDLPSVLRQAESIERVRTVERHANLAKIAVFAEEEAEEIPDAAVSEEATDPDWVTRWRLNAQEVSDEDVQRWWARILAGELSKPGTYALRTLDALRNMSKPDAQLVEKLGPFVISDFLYNGDERILGENGLHLESLLVLQELGIVGNATGRGLQIEIQSTKKDKFENSLISNDLIIIVTTEDSKRIAKINSTINITHVGMQLLKLGRFVSDENYLRLVGQCIKEQGFRVRLGRSVQNTVRQDRVMVVGLVDL